MLDFVVKNKKTFDMLNFIDYTYNSYFLGGSEETHEIPPMDIDWKKTSVFVKFVKNFYYATLNLSASTHVTTHR